MAPEREYAIQCGINNLVETVIIDRAMSRDDAVAGLVGFIDDALVSHGMTESTADDVVLARSMLPS